MTNFTRGPAAPVFERDGDPLGRVTLEEKVGLLFHTVIGVGEDGALDRGGTEKWSRAPRPLTWGWCA
jgi:hypothetical protein